MIDNRKVMALIPARGGSKRLPRKNVRDFAGKPLIAWSILAAQASRHIDRIVVSTDDEEVARIARQFGADVPFMRPANLASDTATTNDVILHALDALDVQNDILVVLQPTSPLRTAGDIDAALAAAVSKGAAGIVSVCPCEHSPLWANVLPDDHGMAAFLRVDVRNRRSQDLPQYYRLNGAIYAFDVPALRRENGLFYGEGVFAHVMPVERSMDIDSEFDFVLAERALQYANGV